MIISKASDASSRSDGEAYEPIRRKPALAEAGGGANEGNAREKDLRFPVRPDQPGIAGLQLIHSVGLRICSLPPDPIPPLTAFFRLTCRYRLLNFFQRG